MKRERRNNSVRVSSGRPSLSVNNECDVVGVTDESSASSTLLRLFFIVHVQVYTSQSRRSCSMWMNAISSTKRIFISRSMQLMTPSSTFQTTVSSRRIVEDAERLQPFSCCQRRPSRPWSANNEFMAAMQYCSIDETLLSFDIIASIFLSSVPLITHQLLKSFLLG